MNTAACRGMVVNYLGGRRSVHPAEYSSCPPPRGRLTAWPLDARGASLPLCLLWTWDRSFYLIRSHLSVALVDSYRGRGPLSLIGIAWAQTQWIGQMSWVASTKKKKRGERDEIITSWAKPTRSLKRCPRQIRRRDGLDGQPPAVAEAGSGDVRVAPIDRRPCHHAACGGNV